MALLWRTSTARATSPDCTHVPAVLHTYMPQGPVVELLLLPAVEGMGLEKGTTVRRGNAGERVCANRMDCKVALLKPQRPHFFLNHNSPDVERTVLQWPDLKPQRLSFSSVHNWN